MKTRNIYLIVWLMLIACTAQAQLKCGGCVTPDPLIPAGGGTYQGDIVLIPAGGGTYQGDIVLTKNAFFDIAGHGNFELSGVISGDFNIWINAFGAKLILSGKNTYTGETVVGQGALGGGVDATGKSPRTVIRSGAVLSGGSPGNPGIINLEKLEFEFDPKWSHFTIYASDAALSLVKLKKDGTGEVKAHHGCIIDIMDPITLPDGDYPIIQCKTNAELVSKLVIGKNSSGRCVSVIRTNQGISLRVKTEWPISSTTIAGPTAVCAGNSITLSVSSIRLTQDTPGEWTLKNDTGNGTIHPVRLLAPKTNNSREAGTSYADLEGVSAGTVMAMFAVGGCDKSAEYPITVKPLPAITFNPPIHPVVATGADLEHNPGSTNIIFSSTVPETNVTWQVSKKRTWEGDKAHIQLSKDGSTLEEIPVEGSPKLTSIRPEAGPVVYKLTANDGGSADLIFEVVPQYILEGATCYGAPNSIMVNVAGAEIPADAGLKETPETAPCETKFTGPVAVCIGDFITLSAAGRGITKDTPGEWTLKNNTGKGLINLTNTSVDVGKSDVNLKGVSEGTVTAVFTPSGCDKSAEYTVTVKALPDITFNPPEHPEVGAGVDLEHNPGSTNISFSSIVPGTMVTWQVSKKQAWDADKAHVQISKDGSALEEIPVEGRLKLTSTRPKAGPVVYKLTSNEDALAGLIFDIYPQYTSEGQTCYGDPKSITVNVAGVEIPTDIGSLEETSKTTPLTVTPEKTNERSVAILCEGSETNIKVGKEGDGNLYRWYSVDADHGIERNSVRPNNEGATIIKERLTLSKKHSTSVVYYITAVRDHCVGATARLPVVVNPTPSITTTLDKSFINNNTAVSFELATNIEEAEADKVTYTWTVSENKVGAISESTPVKKMLPQTLTHTATVDESVIYSFIPTYTHSGVVCTGATVTSEVLVRAIVVIKEAADKIADKTTGDIATDRGISVYPVPAKDQVTIASQEELTGIAIRDMSGKNVMRTEANGYEKSISVSTLPAGLYILEIVNSGGVKRVKMIKE